MIAKPLSWFITPTGAAGNTYMCIDQLVTEGPHIVYGIVYNFPIHVPDHIVYQTFQYMVSHIMIWITLGRNAFKTSGIWYAIIVGLWNIHGVLKGGIIYGYIYIYVATPKSIEQLERWK